MATVIHGAAYVSPVAERRSALDRSELDDLIEELLRDVDEYRRQSPRRPRSRGSTGDRSRSGSACSRSDSRPAPLNDSTSGTIQNSSASSALQIDIEIDQRDAAGYALLSAGSSPGASSVGDNYSAAGW